jgi:polyisoprenoid-binding protein YceI
LNSDLFDYLFLEVAMKKHLILFYSVILLVLLTTGCVSSQASPVAVQDTPVPPASSSPVPVNTVTAGSTQAAPTTLAQLPATGTTPSSSSSGDLLVCTLVQGKSVAQYKVREQLARLSFPSDAVGKTQDVTGTIAFKQDGSIDQSVSKFVVGLTALQTDSNMRDNYVRRNILQTDQYPQAVFIPTEATGFPLPLPQSGSVAFKLTGNLTIKDVTKPVTLDVTGTVQNNSFTGTASTSFKFEDFNLPQPQVPVVLSVVDNINLELDITMQRAQN